jgi:hypothetical protein
MAFSKAAPRASLHFAKITLHFPKLQGEIGSPAVGDNLDALRLAAARVSAPDNL